MAAEQRKLLEQLMGAIGTNPLAPRAPQLLLSDPKACRSFIVGTCPRDLFTNTKQDSGPCPKIHSEPLKAEWAGLSDRERQSLGFEYDYLRDLQKYLEQCNGRIQTAQARLEKTPDEIRVTNMHLHAISGLTASINAGLLEAEILGEMGEVIRAVDELFRVRQAQHAKAERERELKALSETQGPSGHQKLQVCDVCGAYLSRLDNDRRLADHFYGKMHLGYAQMRKAYEAYPREMRARVAGRGGGAGLYEDDADRGDRMGGGGDRMGGGGFGIPGGPRGPRGGGGGGAGGFRGGRGGRGGYRGGHW